MHIRKFIIINDLVCLFLFFRINLFLTMLLDWLFITWNDRQVSIKKIKRRSKVCYTPLYQTCFLHQGIMKWENRFERDSSLKELLKLWRLVLTWLDLKYRNLFDLKCLSVSIALKSFFSLKLWRKRLNSVLNEFAVVNRT